MIVCTRPHLTSVRPSSLFVCQIRRQQQQQQQQQQSERARATSPDPASSDHDHSTRTSSVEARGWWCLSPVGVGALSKNRWVLCRRNIFPAERAHILYSEAHAATFQYTKLPSVRSRSVACYWRVECGCPTARGLPVCMGRAQIPRGRRHPPLPAWG
jgi:hypothetical protein